MNFAKRNKSIIDFVFILALFSAFMITALFVVVFGSRIYKKAVSDMDANFSSRTALSYVTEKVRSHDYNGGIEVADIDDSSVNGNSTLVLYTTTEYGEYSTYMFVKDGYLKEYTAPVDSEFDYEKGTDILEISEFRVEKENDSLYSFHIVDAMGNATEFYVSLYSGSDGEEILND